MLANHLNQISEGQVDGKMEQVSRMILDYLRKNPEAGDTLEGITEWWMNVQRIEFSTKEVGEALENLAEQGKIRIIERKDGSTAYAIGNQNRLDHSHS